MIFMWMDTKSETAPQNEPMVGTIGCVDVRGGIIIPGCLGGAKWSSSKSIEPNWEDPR